MADVANDHVRSDPPWTRVGDNVSHMFLMWLLSLGATFSETYEILSGVDVDPVAEPGNVYVSAFPVDSVPVPDHVPKALDLAGAF